jgi:hypothetical protein
MRAGRAGSEVRALAADLVDGPRVQLAVAFDALVGDAVEEPAGQLDGDVADAAGSTRR